VSSTHAIPTSRAYWELRAEQVLNRVFAPEAPIVVDICDTVPTQDLTAEDPPAAAQTPASPLRPPSSRAAGPWWSQEQHQPALLLTGMGLLLTVMAGTGLLGLSLWHQSQQAIRQERNMLLVERLREIGPATVAEPDPEVVSGNRADTTSPPPPPSEPWMEELATLPASTAPAAGVLRVPMNDKVGQPAPPANGILNASASASNEPLPQLVGVVQVPGRPGSAIFQVEGSSSSAAAGESIGSSGWRLRSAEGDSAVIERDGKQRRVSISSGL
jgi:hypothetical protein